jgi:hypothetical protein
MRLDEREVREQLYNAFKAKVKADFPQDFARFFHKWLVNYRSDPSFLYEVIGLLEDGKPHDALEDTTRSIRYGRFEDGLFVEIPSFSQTVPTEAARFVLRLFIDLLQDYLPLGSVVDLKKELLASVSAFDRATTLRFVITQRFCPLPGTDAFYPYGSVVYPLGRLQDQQQSLYFTAPLIAQVVHKGFFDETEFAYMLAMKHELILKRGCCSAGLLSAQERALLQTDISTDSKGEQHGR